MIMNKLMYQVLSPSKGDAVIGAYRETLKFLDKGVSLDDINEAFSNQILSLFSSEVKSYCNRNFKIEQFVAWEIVDDLQTYHYL